MNDFTKIDSIEVNDSRLRQSTLWVALAAMAILVLGCSGSAESQEDDSEEGYAVIGQIMGIIPEQNVLTVAHEEIPGYMPAMTMQFRVTKGDIENADMGQKIRARMLRDEDGGFRLVKIWPLDEDGQAAVEKANEALKKRMKALSSGRYLGETDAAPSFALYDQSGQLFKSETLQGKTFMMNFIFTRCNDAKMCPLSTANMANMQRMAKKQGVENLSFVSITLDPEFDTPGVLRSFAKQYGIAHENFHFLTGPKEAVYELIRALGVTALPNGDQVVHSLATSLVGPDGTIVMRSTASAWSPEAFLEKAAAL